MKKEIDLKRLKMHLSCECVFDTIIILPIEPEIFAFKGGLENIETEQNQCQATLPRKNA